MSSPLIDRGRAALRDGDVAGARRAFGAALAEDESGEALEGLGEALYLEREYAEAAAHYERAYAAYRREGRSMDAGRAARTVAWITGNVFGDWAVQSGWFGRAGTILEEAGTDGPERGWVLIMRSYAEPDVPAREALLGEALTIGRRFGDPDVEFEALSHLGCLHVMSGRVEQGMLLLDEALAAICADELREVATVDSIMCGLFWACELVNDVPRADQWMRATAGLVRRHNVVAAFCRAHYGGILTAAGRWNEAETELLQAARHFDRGMPQRRAAAMIRLADLRVRQGRLEEAAQLLAGWTGTRTRSAPWPPSTWPAARRPWPVTCSSGPQPPRTTTSRRSASPAWPARCWPCWSTSISPRATWRRPSGRPGASSWSPGPSGGPT